MNPHAHTGLFKKEICIYWSVYMYLHTAVDRLRKHVVNQFLITNMQNVKVVRIQATTNAIHVPISFFFKSTLFIPHNQRYILLKIPE